MSSKLTDAIEEMVREKTFGLDALNAINTLKAKAASQEAELAKIKATSESWRENALEQGNQVKALTARVTAFEQRESELAGRERSIFEHEKAKAVAEARYDSLSHAFSTVFRNTVLRERTMENVAVPGYNGMHGYVNQMPRDTIRETDPQFA